MSNFVETNSIVRWIWGKTDTILFIFAGASAEFALNKAVDWLYFTGKLPADPIGRLLSTVTYARAIVFSTVEKANESIDRITAIHSAVESSRGASIPDWAYRDVLFMLIHYSIAAFEVLERKLTEDEKEQIFETFYRVGKRMGLKDLPHNYGEWMVAQQEHLNRDLIKSNLSIDLFRQYKKHLGVFRYSILKQSQILVVPEKVRLLLGFGKFSWLTLFLPLYKFLKIINGERIVKEILLPKEYRSQLIALDVH